MPDVKHPRYLVCYDSGRHYSWHDSLAEAMERVAHGGTVYERFGLSAAERVVAGEPSPEMAAWLAEHVSVARDREGEIRVQVAASHFTLSGAYALQMAAYIQAKVAEEANHA